MPAHAMSAHVRAWLVAMTEKASKAVHGGRGHHDWTFEPASAGGMTMAAP